MDDLNQLLTKEEIDQLRSAYDAHAVFDLKVQVTAAVYPPHEPWAAMHADSFFRHGPLEGRQRELCLVTLLAYRSPGLSLAFHIYGSLMEGASVPELCHAIGISGGYGGMPAYVAGMRTAKRTLQALKEVATDPASDLMSVFRALVAAFPV